MSFAIHPTVRKESLVESVASDDKFISGFGLVTAFVIGLAYWFIDHNWDASDYAYIMSESYTGSDNITADRLSTVNFESSISRLALAGWGCLCFLLRTKGSIRFSSPVFLSIAFLTCYLYASVLWSIKPSQTLFKLTVLLAMAMAAFGIASRFSLREFLCIVSIICVGYIFIGVIGEIAHGYLKITSEYRFIGTTHPNTEAIYASLLCIVARMFFTKVGNTNLWGASIFTLGLGAVWFTKSRTTLAGMVLSLLITQVLVVRGTNRLLLITFGLLATGLGIIGSSFLSQRSAGSLGTLVSMGRKDDVSSLSGRLPLWEELLTSINKRPVLGHGYLGYWDHKRVEYLSATFRWEIPHGHNLYLDTLLDGGVVGLFLLIVAMLCALYESARLYSQRNQIEYAIAFGLFAYGIANGLAESLFKLPSFPLFVVLACCFSMVFVNEERPSTA